MIDGNMVLFTEGTPDNSNEIEYFSYKGERANA